MTVKILVCIVKCLVVIHRMYSYREERERPRSTVYLRYVTHKVPSTCVCQTMLLFWPTPTNTHWRLHQSLPRGDINTSLSY